MTTNRRDLVAFLALITAVLTTTALAGCSTSHGPGGGTACGPSTCAAGQTCCDSRCGLCGSADECGWRRCDIGVDGGAPTCAGARCLGLCCPSCPGSADVCVEGTECPAFDCPPPRPGCESCAPGTLCCEGCPGELSFCEAGSSCPPLACPAVDCGDTMPCDEGRYCQRAAACGGPGRCVPRPSACPEDCPGVCGCDGTSYCNECMAAAAGVNVTGDFACSDLPCAGRPYCDCGGGCEPIVDLTPGCICPCDDPFNCTGETCDCACGGAHYLGCAPTGACPVTQLACEEGPGCSAVLGADGCPLCVCAE